MTDPRPVLVSGATGKQGGATARALLAAGTPVRALVRDPSSAPARALAAAGATLVRGDLDDPASLSAAAAGARAVFSVQMPDLADLMGDREVRHARNLVTAARAAGAEQVVHTSVSGAGHFDRDAFDEPRWGAYMGHYWASKAAAEELARSAGFDRWTIIRPATFMENLVRPSYLYAESAPDRMRVAVDPDALFAWVAVRDVGTAAAAAFADPDRFAGVELELAGDRVSYRTAARLMSAALGTTIEPPAGPEAALADGLLPEMARGQQYSQHNPAPARPDAARALGVPTTTFEEWARTDLVRLDAPAPRSGS
ncbi:NmrA family NAD(P)-binding protein [Dactylosporangium sp. CA-092794]|uniref:NmrA family NAD(P)-binding protein n=1 Tax=Dactylosporangium sp. CA-092794 TaxID=3239929 RepID=UPI003D8CE1DD